ncbi:MAG: polyprenyl synthetase family protein, partial [bacterium]
LKTGSIFRWCAVCACHFSGHSRLMENCARLGEEAGICFQIIDDVLDFDETNPETGKDALKDITDGCFTLPVLTALADGNCSAVLEEKLAVLKSSVWPDMTAAEEISGLVREGGFLEKARHEAYARLKNLTPFINALPLNESAADLKNYLWELLERTY